jgi:N-acetylglucosaminyldiphosphoundecaprenol N-acetyl-beta-D-mannosaminyltransferase
MAELVSDGRTGLLFEPGNARDLAEKARWLFGHPDERRRMGREARREFEVKYTAERNHAMLMDIYAKAMARRCTTGFQPVRTGRMPVLPAAAGRPCGASPSRPGTVDVAGVGVSRTSYEDAAARIGAWASRGEARYVAVTSAHGIVTARRDPAFRDVLDSADMVVPDGTPVVWTMRLSGAPGQRRVYGPTLMEHVCREAAARSLPVFLYGTTEATLSRLSRSLAARFPGLRIAGTHAPPFRPLTPEEDARVVELIRGSRARVVFVGLSTPRQELWMRGHAGRLDAVMIGVGAAFDFHAGTLSEAPRWMQSAGIEWLYRLLMEPARLWRRYAGVVPRFAGLALLQVLRGPGGLATR